MKKISFEEMRKIFDKAVETTFNDKYQQFDSVDKTYVHQILLSDGIMNFYYCVGLKFIEEYLTKITEKD